MYDLEIKSSSASFQGLLTNEEPSKDRNQERFLTLF